MLNDQKRKGRARPDAARTWGLTYRLMGAVLANVTPDLEALALEPKDLFLLAEVDEHPYPAELAATLFIPKPTVTFVVKRLEGAGLLRREIDPADLRRHRLLLTDAGRTALRRGLGCLSEAFGARLAQLTVEEQRSLVTLLEKLS